MARVLDKFKRQTNPYVKADGRNYEGFPTFLRSDQEAYLQVLLTNTLSGTFYASEETLLKESLDLHQKITSSDPEFAARALVYARNEGLMRLQPIVGLAYLAKADRVLFRKIFGRVILTPGDLSDFVEIVRGDVTPGGMGRSIKNAIGAWLATGYPAGNGMSEYHAIKYGTGGQGYSLRDILRVTHPKPISPKQDAIFLWLTDREKWAAAPEKRALTPQIEAFETLKNTHVETGGDQAEARAIIEKGKLPYEVATGVIKPDLETWGGLMRQMPYMALMRHLNTLQRAGVLKISENAEYVAGRLVDEKALQKAKVLPFRLFMAHTMFNAEDTVEKYIDDALIDALEKAFVNLPDLGGRVCIAPDVSGSMGGVISRDSKVRFIDIAGIFAGALLKASKTALVMPFDTQVHNAKLSGRDSVMTNAKKITKYGGGGTAVSAPISELLHKGTVIDTFIGITDSEEWARDHHGGHGFLAVWNEYKQKIAPQAKAFLLTIAPYRQAVAPQDAKEIFYIYGWNDNVLKYISLIASGMTGQVEQVRAMEV